jgi:hypothetical protein
VATSSSAGNAEASPDFVLPAIQPSIEGSQTPRPPKPQKTVTEDNSSLLIKQTPAARSHYMLPLLVKALKARCHVWLVGPAGSGKSAIAGNAAAELNLLYASLSVCGQTTKTDILGYMDAQGAYRTTSFRQAYEKGGVFCLDEVDNGNANVLAVINSALSNSICTFPDKTVERHPNFIVIACANTFGLGAQAGYVGRTQIDAATLDRFFFIEMPYDEGLEMHIAGISNIPSPVWNAEGTYVPTAEEWFTAVKTTRARVMELNARAIISPRATLMGAALIKQEIPLQFLQKGLLYKGLSADLVSKLRQ